MIHFYNTVFENWIELSLKTFSCKKLETVLKTCVKFLLLGSSTYGRFSINKSINALLAGSTLETVKFDFTTTSKPAKTQGLQSGLQRIT